MLTVLLGLAWGHDAIGSIAQRPLFDGSELVGAHTSWGLVLGGDEDWERVCEEALPGLRDAWRFGDGTVWLATSEGLVAAVEGACSTEPVGLLPRVEGFVGGDVLYVHTVDGVWRADPPALPTACGVLPGPVNDVAIGASGAVWATGGGGEPWLRHSVDGCASWVETTLPETDATFVELHEPGLGGVLLATWRVDGRGGLWAQTLTEATPLGVADQPPSALACLPDLCFVATNRSVLARFDPEAGLSEATVVPDGPAACLWIHDGELWACTDVDEADHLVHTTDGESWTGELPRDAVVERACPTGSPGAEACAREDTGWVDTGVADGAIELVDDPARCGCGLAQASWPGALMRRR